jgi:hypothetical protein
MTLRVALALSNCGARWIRRPRLGDSASYLDQVS